jgi:hypothetical protein
MARVVKKMRTKDKRRNEKERRRILFFFKSSHNPNSKLGSPDLKTNLSHDFSL